MCCLLGRAGSGHLAQVFGIQWVVYQEQIPSYRCWPDIPQLIYWPARGYSNCLPLWLFLPTGEQAGWVTRCKHAIRSTRPCRQRAQQPYLAGFLSQPLSFPFFFFWFLRSTPPGYSLWNSQEERNAYLELKQRNMEAALCPNVVSCQEEVQATWRYCPLVQGKKSVSRIGTWAPARGGTASHWLVHDGGSRKPWYPSDWLETHYRIIFINSHFFLLKKNSSKHNSSCGFNSQLWYLDTQCGLTRESEMPSHFGGLWTTLAFEVTAPNISRELHEGSPTPWSQVTENQ